MRGVVFRLLLIEVSAGVLLEFEDEVKNKMFSNERLVRIIEKFGNRSASELHRYIIDALKLYETPDDVTLVVIKRNRD